MNAALKETRPELVAVRPPKTPRFAVEGDYLTRLAERAKTDADLARVLIERESLLDRIEQADVTNTVTLDAMRGHQSAVDAALEHLNGMRDTLVEQIVLVRTERDHYREKMYSLMGELERVRCSPVDVA